MTEQVKCAVCGKVTTKQVAFQVYHQGKPFYTCGSGCREQFMLNPSRFTQAAATSPTAGSKTSTTPQAPKAQTTSAPPPSSKPQPKKKP